MERTGHGEDGILVERTGQGMDGIFVERTGRGWNRRGKGGKVLAAIFGEFAWHSVIDGIDAFF